MSADRLSKALETGAELEAYGEIVSAARERITRAVWNIDIAAAAHERAAEQPSITEGSSFQQMERTVPMAAGAAFNGVRQQDEFVDSARQGVEAANPVPADAYRLDEAPDTSTPAKVYNLAEFRNRTPEQTPMPLHSDVVRAMENRGSQEQEAA